MHWLSLLNLLLWLLHVSALLCHLQGASFILMSYLKGRNGCVVVMYCECWWPVCTGCCGFVLRYPAEHIFINPAVLPWGLRDPSPLWLTFFFKLMNTDIAFYVFFSRKAFLTMSHKFTSFCVFPFIFICLFPFEVKWTPKYLPRNVDNYFFFFCEVLWRAERNIT
jgi:hypothetical protein